MQKIFQANTLEPVGKTPEQYVQLIREDPDTGRARSRPPASSRTEEFMDLNLKGRSVLITGASRASANGLPK